MPEDSPDNNIMIPKTGARDNCKGMTTVVVMSITTYATNSQTAHQPIRVPGFKLDRSELVAISYLL